MKSEKIELLVKALIKAKAAIKPVEKNKVNPFFKSTYATLDAVEAAVKGPLHDNGLVVTQTTDVLPTGAVLVTTLMHESGQWIAGHYPLNPAKSDPQGLGAATTYARRYALSALLGIVSDEDDDGNSVSHTNGHKSEPKVEAKHQTRETPEGATIVEFVPAAVSIKTGEKNGKAWKQYGVKDHNGAWYSTFDEPTGQMAQRCKDAGVELKVYYVIKGDFKNIVKAEESVAF